jgi:hypothetical protein
MIDESLNKNSQILSMVNLLLKTVVIFVKKIKCPDLSPI